MSAKAPRKPLNGRKGNSMRVISYSSLLFMYQRRERKFLKEETSQKSQERKCEGSLFEGKMRSRRC